jgi:hypothetical protein
MAKRKKPACPFPTLTFRSEDVVIRETLQHVYVAGERFGLTDLLDTLEQAKEDTIMITNQRMIRVLKAVGVLQYEGSRRVGVGATLGPHGPALIEKLRKRWIRIRKADGRKRKRTSGA